MKITEKEYKIILGLPEKSILELILRKHVLFEAKVEQLIGYEKCDLIWDEVNNDE